MTHINFNLLVTEMKTTSFITILCLFLATGCDNATSGEQNAVETTPETTSTTATVEPATNEVDSNPFDSPAFIGKYNEYIDFVNGFNDNVNSSYSRYASWVDLETGPDAEGIVYGLYSLYGENYLDDLKAAIDSRPQIDKVDVLMSQILEKSRHLDQVVAEAEKYYDREDYKDDGFAKGKALHPSLMRAFDEYFTAYAELSVELSALGDALFIHEAEKFKNAGHLIRYNMMMTLHEAEGVIATLQDAEALSAVDLDRFNDKVSQFKTAFDALENSASDDESVKGEFGHEKFRFVTFIDRCVDLVKESRNLKERVETKNYEYSITHPTIPDTGSPLKLMEIYGEMVEAYNGLAT